MEFAREELRAAIATLPCRQCGSIGGIATIEREGPHFARVECESCGYWIDWLGWPPDPQRERRATTRRIERLGDDRCELCLRARFELPPPAQLETHHVIQVEAGGTDEPGNLRVYCTPCHRLVHWARTYFGHYHLDNAA